MLTALGLLALALGLSLSRLEKVSADTCASQFFVWKAVGGSCAQDYANCTDEIGTTGTWKTTQGLKWCYNNPPSLGFVETDDFGTTSNVEITNLTPSYWQPFAEGGAGETVDPFDVEWEGTISGNDDGSAGVTATHWPGRLGGSTDTTTKNVAVNNN
jgi:hypothetical protein